MEPLLSPERHSSQPWPSRPRAENGRAASALIAKCAGCRNREGAGRWNVHQKFICASRPESRRRHGTSHAEFACLLVMPTLNDPLETGIAIMSAKSIVAIRNFAVLQAAWAGAQVF